MSLTTPEGVRLLLTPAGPVARAWAWAIDLLIWLAFVGIVAMLLSGSKLGRGVLMVLMFVSFWGYPIICEVYFGGRTPGKRALGIEVLRADGLPVGWRESMLRNLMLVADFLPLMYATGLLSMLFDSHFRRLGDIVAGTVVVYREKPPLRAETPDVRAIPLPFPLTPYQQRTLTDLFERESQLPPARLEELGSIAAPLTGREGEASLERMRGYVANDPIKRKQFGNEHASLWEKITAILQGKSDQATALPSLYRRLCQSLTLSSQRGYSPALTDYLQKMVGDSHKRLYGTKVARPLLLRYWMLQEFPQRVRAEWRLVTLALLAFWGVALAVGVLVWIQPHWAYSFMSPHQLNEYHSMYQPGKMSVGRGGDQGDVLMFGFYIWNNVSIGFRTFAGGIFGGIPALVSMMFNGVSMGVVGSWLSKDPVTRDMFWSFVITHSSFEITGLLLSGVAGMRLGLSLIHPGRLSRRHALFAASQYMFPVMVGAALLTALAAFFEAFWSASAAIPINVKYGVGAVCWLLVIGFFAFAGRSRR